ncbi:hypothetical protein M0R45_030283 [Rubus argutus]|uniref:Uncharacterized protein n=1 Tax=Rubus argutus TaxID=59490 RepID=A0AAW1WAM4_RUBAR
MESTSERSRAREKTGAAVTAGGTIAGVVICGGERERARGSWAVSNVRFGSTMGSPAEHGLGWFWLRNWFVEDVVVWFCARALGLG